MGVCQSKTKAAQVQSPEGLRRIGAHLQVIYNIANLNLLGSLIKV